MRGFCPSYFFGGIMDIIKKWFLRIDIEREFDTPIIELYMQDVKTNLFITTLTNNGARISLKDYNIVTLNVLKADDTKLMVSGKVTEDGNVIFEMDSQATSVKGICSATIRIYEGDSSVTSKPFYFTVIDDPYRGTDNSIISQNSYTALQNILSQTAKALEEAVKVNDYFKINLPTVKELISYEPILKDIVKNKDEAKALIRESKNLQVKIDASMADLKRLEGLIPEVNRLVDKGNETIRALTNATEDVSEAISKADIKKSELEDILSRFKDIDERAQKIKLISDEVNSLLPKLDEARGVKSGLDSTIASAKSNKLELEKTLTSAGDINRDLGSKIDQSKTLSNNLKADIENAKNTNSTLNSDRETAKLIVTELKNAKNDADVINSELNSTKIKADSAKTELIKLIEQSKNLKLKELIDQSSNLEESLKEIIASGDLSKYVTEPKLQDALKDYATKVDLQSIDVTKQLADYAKKVDVPKKLSQLEEDESHRIVTNKDIERWNKKYGKDEVNDLIDKRVKEEARINTQIMTAVIDQSNSNPLTCVTYEDDAKTMEKGSAEWDKFFGTKLVLFKDGKEVRDLEDAELDNLKPEDGDVMVKFKRMGLNIKTVDDKVYVSMTDDPDDENFKYYSHTRGAERREAFYLGAYLGYEEDGKLRSIKGYEPTGEKTIIDFRKIAQANGSGYEQIAFYQLTFLQAMYVLKYGNLDSQTALGRGLVDGNKHEITGGTNNKGIDHGTQNETEQMRFQYLEDFWGNKVQFIDGVVNSYIENNGNYKPALIIGTEQFENLKSLGKKYEVNSLSGYTSKVCGSNELGFVPKEGNGSETTCYCDYTYLDAAEENYAYFGGCVGYGSYSGTFCLDFEFGASSATPVVGARLMYL